MFQITITTVLTEAYAVKTDAAVIEIIRNTILPLTEKYGETMHDFKIRRDEATRIPFVSLSFNIATKPLFNAGIEVLYKTIALNKDTFFETEIISLKIKKVGHKLIKSEAMPTKATDDAA